MSDDNVTEIKPNNSSKAKTPEQFVKEAKQKIENRKASEFQKVIDNLIEKKNAAEKAVSLIDKEIDDAMAKFKAGIL